MLISRGGKVEAARIYHLATSGGAKCVRPCSTKANVLVGVASDEETRIRHSLIAMQAAPAAIVNMNATTHRVATILANRTDMGGTVQT